MRLNGIVILLMMTFLSEAIGFDIQKMVASKLEEQAAADELRAQLTALLDPPRGRVWAAGDRWDRDHGPYFADQRHFCRRMVRHPVGEGLSMTAGLMLSRFLVAVEEVLGLMRSGC
ncbi:hypothetical protein [Parasynechococcus sp.]|uniref:hypothetical protein n=1 Tax=Parasynechococcus sp. TaxID=3101203 RepID=UPI003704BEBB